LAIVYSLCTHAYICILICMLTCSRLCQQVSRFWGMRTWGQKRPICKHLLPYVSAGLGVGLFGKSGLVYQQAGGHPGEARNVEDTLPLHAPSTNGHTNFSLIFGVWARLRKLRILPRPVVDRETEGERVNGRQVLCPYLDVSIRTHSHVYTCVGMRV
jgi:hypothetical protein